MVKRIDQNYKDNLEGLIEYAGRTCYNSTHKITENSKENFIRNIIKTGHTSVLEHSRIIIRLKPADIHGMSEQFLMTLLSTNGLPLMVDFVGYDENKEYLISGNVRQYRDLFLTEPNFITAKLISCVGKYYPISTGDVIYQADTIANRSEDQDILILDVATTSDQTKHNWATFEIEFSRRTEKQLLRHRYPFSPSIQSQRYVKENKAEYFTPPTILHNEETWIVDEFDKFMHQALQKYNWFLEHGVKKEDARDVLPMAWKGKGVFTSTYKGWESFLKLRIADNVQEEIRFIAEQIRELL